MIMTQQHRLLARNNWMNFINQQWFHEWMTEYKNMWRSADKKKLSENIKRHEMWQKTSFCFNFASFYRHVINKAQNRTRMFKRSRVASVRFRYFSCIEEIVSKIPDGDTSVKHLKGEDNLWRAFLLTVMLGLTSTRCEGGHDLQRSSSTSYFPL